MLKVWGRRSSFNVQKVMWLIGELERRHLPAARPAALMTRAHFWVSVPM